MITADGGGFNDSRVKLSMVELQKLADQIDLTLRVCRYLSGTPKWNKIRHRLFRHVTRTWRGTVDQPSGRGGTDRLTTARTGLKMRRDLGTRIHPKAIKVGDEEMATLNIKGGLHPEWHSIICPRVPP